MVIPPRMFGRPCGRGSHLPYSDPMPARSVMRGVLQWPSVRPPIRNATDRPRVTHIIAGDSCTASEQAAALKPRQRIIQPDSCSHLGADIAQRDLAVLRN
jgi:hypothetical protein